ncbi:Acyl-CoA dehydrogenase (plasmid) [Variovorax sp. WDL1]|nr:Acryloyl-CoA reductase (NADH) [Variovorax sp. B2]PNG46310.1 Acryloyl-CoA reductase (NADH) [Variovorax sp. B4]VTV19128.1 Acyl-CoA dehydrogenase [Variovorax sp. WDL1]
MSAEEDHITALRDSAKAFSRRNPGVARARQLRDSGGGVNREMWRTMAGVGWPGILVPEEFGGLGLGLREMGNLLEEISRDLAPEPLNAAAAMAPLLLTNSDNVEIRDSLLQQVAAGDAILAVAWQEFEGDLAPGAVKTSLDKGRLNGVKRFVVPADADGYLVSVRSGDGMVICFIKRGVAGLSVTHELAADGTTLGLLHLDGVEVSEGVVASTRVAARALTLAIESSTVLAGAELLGVISRALEMTLDHMRVRVQFGKPIGAFQALQHRVSDLYIQQVVCESVVRDALDSLSSDGSQLSRWASRVKARCSEAAMNMAREVVQLHGAIGYADECDIGLFVQKCIVLASWLGNACHHRLRYCEMQQASAAA